MRWTVAAVLSVLLAGVLLAPVLAKNAGVASVALYAAFSWVCHQRPQRTWRIGALPLGVCVRCLGVYLGALAGAVAGARFSKARFWTSTVLLAAEWLAEAAVRPAAPAWPRFLAGLFAGFCLIPALWAEPKRTTVRIGGTGEVGT
jgi:hypothetical protein